MDEQRSLGTAEVVGGVFAQAASASSDTCFDLGTEFAARQRLAALERQCSVGDSNPTPGQRIAAVVKEVADAGRSLAAPVAVGGESGRIEN
jgi:hypothetical protein